MLASELNARATKLQREQKERAERERQRLEKERLLLERQKARAAAREEEARQRRLAQLAAAQAEEEHYAAELEHNRGVHLRLSLQAVPMDEAVAASKGIKRWLDKIVLPASAQHRLLDQDASKNGAMLFEVTAPSGARTHAGVLEFTAPEGVVLLPPKVVQSLWGSEPTSSGTSSDDADDSSDRPSTSAQATTSDSPAAAAAAATAGAVAVPGGKVTVAYWRLDKGTYVNFQPELRQFHEDLGDGEEMRSVLEDALMACCTLTEGDWLEVPHGGKVYRLRVLELQPASAVSILDTDIAADVGPSIETEGYLRAREEALAREACRLRQLQQEREQQAQQALEAAQAHEALKVQQAAEQAAQAARQQMEAEARKLEAHARLPAEPSPEEPHTTVMFRLADGSRASRRFALSHPLQELFDFADSVGAGGLLPDSYQLVGTYPRRVFAPQAAAVGVTIGGAGFVAGEQQALLVEALQPKESGCDVDAVAA